MTGIGVQGLSYDHSPIGASWEVELSTGAIIHVESDFVGQESDPVDFGSLVSRGDDGSTLTIAEMSRSGYRGSFSSDVALNPPWAGEGPRRFLESALTTWEVHLAGGIVIRISASHLKPENEYMHFRLNLAGPHGQWTETIVRIPLDVIDALSTERTA